MGATMKKNPNQSEELAEIEEKIKHIFIYYTIWCKAWVWSCVLKIRAWCVKIPLHQSLLTPLIDYDGWNWLDWMDGWDCWIEACMLLLSFLFFINHFLTWNHTDLIWSDLIWYTLLTFEKIKIKMIWSFSELKKILTYFMRHFGCKINKSISKYYSFWSFPSFPPLFFLFPDFWLE